MFVDVRYFQLGAIDIPDALDESFLNALILNASAEREGYLQEAHIVRKETEQKVSGILQRWKQKCTIIKSLLFSVRFLRILN